MHILLPWEHGSLTWCLAAGKNKNVPWTCGHVIVTVTFLLGMHWYGFQNVSSHIHVSPCLQAAMGVERWMSRLRSSGVACVIGWSNGGLMAYDQWLETSSTTYCWNTYLCLALSISFSSLHSVHSRGSGNTYRLYHAWSGGFHCSCPCANALSQSLSLNKCFNL